MKTSLVVISTLLVLSVFVPFIIFIYNGAKNTVSIKKQSQLLIKNSGIVYNAKEIWRKNFIGISKDNEILTYISFKHDKPLIINIPLTDIKQCHIIKSYNSNSANKLTSLKHLDLELVYKSASKANVTINFYNLDYDLNEDFELQRIENWQQLIKSSITDQIVNKMAS